ncbi:MAG TPA: anti-sigma factor [Trebonia sp.]|nr:anti-sigma factor [Trebonia sp.]
MRLRLPGPWRRDLHALAGAYALDALDDAERDRFERHLRRCQACQNEVRGFAATAAALGRAAAAEPPAGLKERVLATTTVTRQLPPATATPRWRRAAPGSSAARRGTSRTFWTMPKIATGIAAVALAAVVALAVITIGTNNSLNKERAQNQAIAAVLAAPDARIVSGPTSAGGIATVVASHRAGKIVFTSAGLTVLPSTQVYELWFLGPGTARSAGLVPTAVAGSTAPVLASGLATGDSVGVTVEPAGGTTAPTTTPIVVLAVPA